jgi:hypothetical protein
MMIESLAHVSYSKECKSEYNLFQRLRDSNLFDLKNSNLILLFKQLSNKLLGFTIETSFLNERTKSQTSLYVNISDLSIRESRVQCRVNKRSIGSSRGAVPPVSRPPRALLRRQLTSNIQLSNNKDGARMLHRSRHPCAGVRLRDTQERGAGRRDARRGVLFRQSGRDPAAGVAAPCLLRVSRVAAAAPLRHRRQLRDPRPDHLQAETAGARQEEPRHAAQGSPEANVRPRVRDNGPRERHRRLAQRHEQQQQRRRPGRHRARAVPGARPRALRAPRHRNM